MLGVVEKTFSARCKRPTRHCCTVVIPVKKGIPVKVQLWKAVEACNTTMSLLLLSFLLMMMVMVVVVVLLMI